MNDLKEIGFYTLTSKRARLEHGNMERCEMIVTDACNFRCPYCRGVSAYSRDCSGHMDFLTASHVIGSWVRSGLRNIRFSGGEPTMHPDIIELCHLAWLGGVKRIAISTNGSMTQMYQKLLWVGVNDFSISLDACCAEDADKLAGRRGYFDTVIRNIKFLASETYVTVGVVFTQESADTIVDVIRLAHDLGVADIRIITAAQWDGHLKRLEEIPNDILDAHPILRYRVNNLLSGVKGVRGISTSDTHRCYLVLDDSAVAGKWHFPCVIYMREGGEPIGDVWRGMRAERQIWSIQHDTHNDPICKANCLDCLVDYNNEAHRSYVDQL